MPSKPTTDRRGGGERRSGADRRKKKSRVSRRHSVPAVAGVAGTVAAWAASEISRRYNVPIEVTSPVVGLIFATLAGVYNKVVLPWME
jgi:hypothetical protein